MRLHSKPLLLAFPLLVTLACNLSLAREATLSPGPGSAEPPPTGVAPLQPTQTQSPERTEEQRPDTTAAPTMAPTRGVPSAQGPQEAILILEPGPGSKLISPIRVAGLADPTFEQTLVVRVVLDDGAELALEPLTIHADLGQRGPFEVEVPFSLSAERNALIQVYHQSARDGGIIHLASVGVILAPGGSASVEPGEVHPESIQVLQPAMGEEIRGGTVHVEGIGMASFEGTLVIEVYDVEGNLVGQQPVLVAAPDIGLPGAFSADVPYAVGSEGPGRIVIVNPLPAFDGLGHIASVEVVLAP